MGKLLGGREQFLGLVESVALNEADDGVDLHEAALVLGEQLVFFQL